MNARNAVTYCCLAFGRDSSDPYVFQPVRDLLDRLGITVNDHVPGEEQARSIMDIVMMSFLHDSTPKSICFLRAFLEEFKDANVNAYCGWGTGGRTYFHMICLESQNKECEQLAIELLRTGKADPYIPEITSLMYMSPESFIMFDLDRDMTAFEFALQGGGIHLIRYMKTTYDVEYDYIDMLIVDPLLFDEISRHIDFSLGCQVEKLLRVFHISCRCNDKYKHVFEFLVRTLYPYHICFTETYLYKSVLDVYLITWKHIDIDIINMLLEKGSQTSRSTITLCWKNHKEARDVLHMLFARDCWVPIHSQIDNRLVNIYEQWCHNTSLTVSTFLQTMIMSGIFETIPYDIMVSIACMAVCPHIHPNSITKEKIIGKVDKHW